VTTTSRQRLFGHLTSVDRKVEDRLAAARSCRPARLTGWLGSRGGDLVPVLVLLHVARRPNGWRVGAAIAAQTLLVNLVVKNLVRRPRPNGPGHTSSFPSGHTTTATALAVGLPLGALGTGLLAGNAVAAGLARVVRGVHWCSDVVAGAALGVTVGAGIRMLSRPGRPLD
jgi:membrane-associated phospholipid phosphatase